MGTQVKGHTGKLAVNRHQTQSKTSASNQERAIEKRERQKAKKATKPKHVGSCMCDDKGKDPDCYPT